MTADLILAGIVVAAWLSAAIAVAGAIRQDNKTKRAAE
jgi:hypothetical protein